MIKTILSITLKFLKKLLISMKKLENYLTAACLLLISTGTFDIDTSVTNFLCKKPFPVRYHKIAVFSPTWQ